MFNNVNRIGSSCVKWDMQYERFGKNGLTPFTIADSDYSTPQVVIDALIERVKNGAFGYTVIDDEYRQIVSDWFKRRCDYSIEKEWIVPTHGVINALHFLVAYLTEEGDGVILQTPAYNPFYDIIKKNKRTILINKLAYENGKYTIDYEDLEKKLKGGARMMFFCSPHNPVGRVFTYEEVKKVVDLFKKYNAILISDEIHCDLILNNNKFTSCGKFISEYENIILCTAPSKTFNIAGLQAANIIIPNNKLRNIILTNLVNQSLQYPNILGITACKAAYAKGDDWVEEEKAFLSNNFNYLKKYFKENIKGAKVTETEGTYLAWLDMRFLGISSAEIMQRLVDYGIAINDGKVYCADHDGFLRMNMSCSFEQIKYGLEQIKKFVDDLQK